MLDIRNHRYKKYKAEQSMNEIKNMKKEQWKKLVQNKIIKKLNENFMEQSSN